jgi:hypothetical protein
MPTFTFDDVFRYFQRLKNFRDVRFFCGIFISFIFKLLWSSLLLVKEQQEDNIKTDFQETLRGKHGRAVDL